MTVQILHGDCRDVLRTLADASVDSVVTDPPYHLTQASRGGHTRTNNPEMPHGRHRIVDKGFMGKVWDGGDVAFRAETWAEVLRVLKPGGHLVAFGGTRTYHRMVCAIEDAGFEVRDQIGWLYGSGFPKSLDVSKAIDKAAGAEREVIGDKLDLPGYHLNGHMGGEAFGHGLSTSTPETRMKAAQITAPATEAARQWQGWGTALKPAWEPIVLARKPLVGTVAENVLQHGTGAMNIDGCRVEATDGYVENSVTQGINTARTSYAPAGARRTFEPQPAGRWPANIVHDGSEEVLAAFPQAPGQSGSVTGSEPSSKTRNTFALYNERTAAIPRGDAGSAARFFYCAKADRADRNEGLDGMPERVVSVWGGDEDDLSAGKKSTKPRSNTHPTVKPTDLMRWLCRLITPPGGTVLDPFMGSGSTLKAAELEGFSAIGIELDADYIEIARRRIAADAPLFSTATLSPIAAVSAQVSGGVCAAPNSPEVA